ncbi:hypothetical protein [Nocardioides convexus]|uniref:hypothetical protein n=1 Tax=Nocardioides convexus TaxID=2712224 RepID=UPI002418A60A|nr:hypothetical protein [Nocardioides convexus]
MHARRRGRAARPDRRDRHLPRPARRHAPALRRRLRRPRRTAPGRRGGRRGAPRRPRRRPAAAW